ncbi:hypothetical protein NP233_g2292 [Leucocoprinus birnbaumii]|uniref:Uncharacterized protein n=1 Tax=Leucocoprinus birnbaumii TaxID=56174 RepID=A0AAD5W1N2_9AGAR|nr:hypothetical protein NP233_g2292 [Leucocoprinus birnbaumii]
MSSTLETSPPKADASLASISRQINHYIYYSIFLCLIILACSLVHLGSVSFFLSEAGWLFTIIHHIVVLCNRAKLRKLMRQPSDHLNTSVLPVPISSRKPMIFLAFFSALVYTAALVTNIVFIYYFSLDGWRIDYLAIVFEIVGLAIEFPLLVVIALRCMKERRVALGASDGKWYHLPQYNRAYYQESLYTRYPPVCENCMPVVEEEIRRKDQMARSKALGGWLRDSKGKGTRRRVSAQSKDRDKVVVELYWWKLRGCLWLATSVLSLLFYISAILAYRPFFFLNLLQPVFPLLVLLSILWTVWDPTYASARRAQRQGREVRVIGKKEYIVLQMIIWSTRLSTSVLFWLRWRDPRNDYFELYDSSSQLARIYFSTVTAIEVTAQLLSFYRLRLKQPPTVRLIETQTFRFTPSRSNTPHPSNSDSRGTTPAPPTQSHKASTSSTTEPDLLASLSLSSGPIITPKNPVFGLPSLLSKPPLNGQGEGEGIDIDDDDENAMDWTPTDPRTATSRKRKNNAKQTEDVLLRPQKFFAPEKPTGLESLFARTTLEDDAMMVDGPEDDTAGGSIVATVTRHFKKWWWIYATVVVPVVSGVIARRVWHLEITISAAEQASTPLSSILVFTSKTDTVISPSVTSAVEEWVDEFI